MNATFLIQCSTRKQHIVALVANDVVKVRITRRPIHPFQGPLIIAGAYQVKLADTIYLETMQSINRAILNPAFFLIFFGSLILLVTNTIQQYHAGLTFWLMLAATLIYLVGTFGVTGLGNVPLNDALDALHLNDLSDVKLAQFRQYYEFKWNKLHTIRTVFALISFLFSLIAVFTHSKTIELLKP